MITVVCAWCGQEIGRKEGGEGISHGLCEECLVILEDELDEITKEISDMRSRDMRD
mgnify:CR=1 FL=1